jgi:hypothetical protein
MKVIQHREIRCRPDMVESDIPDPAQMPTYASILASPDCQLVFAARSR